MRELFGRKLKLDQRRIVDETNDTVVFDLKERRPTHPVAVRESPDYYQANKRLGALPSDTLEDIAERNLWFITEYNNGDITPEETSEFYELTGSALIEASFAATQAATPETFDETIEERLAQIEVGVEALLYAKAALGDEPTSRGQRLQLQADFANVYKDIACGELTEQTINETREMLVRHLYDTIKNTDPEGARGLGGELRALIHCWNNYQKPGDEFALPATARGGSGYYLRADTHDLDILRQKPDGSWQVMTPMEIKRTEITDAMLSRYATSRIVHIATDGSFRIAQEPQVDAG